jgi:conjugal transfer/entry exclusion protein
MNQIDTMLIPYARQTALKLVYNLANNDADKSAYEEAKNVLERAIAALDDGRGPADNIERIDGQLAEL